MNDNRNLILAIALSVLVLLGWSFLSQKFLPANPPPKVVNGKVQPAPQPGAAPAPQAEAAAKQSVAQALASTPRIRISTPSLQGSINLKGAEIDDLVLLKQRETITIFLTTSHATVTDYSQPTLTVKPNQTTPWSAHSTTGGNALRCVLRGVGTK